MLDERWVFHENAEAVQAGQGVVRRVLAYSKDLMCVENTFEKGAVGSLHHHPHTQITYVVSGEFEFDIEGEKKIVKAGDTMLKLDGVEHGCVCLEAGILLDIFNPMRQDFVYIREWNGWEFLCMVQGDGDSDEVRMYVHNG